MHFDIITTVLMQQTHATDLTQEGGLIGLVARIIDALSYPGIMLLIAAENIIPPIPSEAILPMAGFLAAAGTFNFWLVVIFATLGSLIGATALYYAGLILGRTKILVLVEQHGSKVGLSLDDVKKAENWFQQRGKISVLVGRLVPIVRSLISIPAGFYGMSLPGLPGLFSDRKPDLEYRAGRPRLSPGKPLGFGRTLRSDFPVRGYRRRRPLRPALSLDASRRDIVAYDNIH
ncbi:MAG: DedA family protein [Thermomicrobiales bacterium]